MLAFGYRPEIFRTNFPEDICLSSGGEKRFKDVEAAYMIIHVVEGQNRKHPSFPGICLGEFGSCTLLLERRIHRKRQAGVIIFCQCQ